MARMFNLPDLRACIVGRVQTENNSEACEKEQFQVNCAFQRGYRMPDKENIRQELAVLRQEHRDLDDAIARLSEALFVNELQLRRLKKRKLQLKDFIARLESKLIPDLDA